MLNTLVISLATSIVLFSTPKPAMLPVVISQHEMSMTNRYAVESVNEVFKKNILLNIAYLNGSVTKKEDINWDQIEKPFNTGFTLNPGETFAYHANILKQFEGKVTMTTKAHFNASDGFVTDGYLYGDGVCHLASIMNWVAQDAGLTVLSLRNHDFAKIPEVPKEYGTAIYMDAGAGADSNLYITNNKSVPVQFHFDFKDNELKVYVTELV